MTTREDTSESTSSRGHVLRLAFAYGLATAAAASLWLVALHVIEGSHERNEPVFILHWLRDAGLALPITFLAAGYAIKVVAARNRAGGALRLPATMALTTSLGLTAGLPVHELLFAAEEAESISLPVHLTREWIVALAAAFCAAVLVHAWHRRCERVLPARMFMVTALATLATGTAAVAWMLVLHLQVRSAEVPGSTLALRTLRDGALTAPFVALVLVVVLGAVARLRRDGRDPRLAWLTVPGAAVAVGVLTGFAGPVTERMLEVFRHGTHPLVDDADLVVLPGSSGGSLAAHLADHTLALMPLFLAVAWVAARLIARAGIRPVLAPTAALPVPTTPPAVAPSGDLWLPAMTRREVLRVGAATGIALSLPFGASTARGDVPASPRFTPFTRKLVFGDPISPSAPNAFIPTCHLDPQFGTPRLYEIDMFENEAEIIPGLGTRIFGYAGTYPGPTFRVREGEPAIVRFRNQLRVPTVIHNHGGHQSGKVGGDPNTDSDSFPDDVIRPGAFKDYCYPHTAPFGDLINSDFTSTQWYHDHAVDITGPNVWAGLAGFYLLTDALEERLIATRVLPATAFDLPLVLQDRRFDRTGRLVYEPEDSDGVLGDVFVVNGKAQPYIEVQRKKYRLRLLNGSNARFYELELSNRAPFLQIGTDSWLLPFAVERSSIRLAMAERADVIVDFRDAPAEVLLMNVLKQEDGRRPGDVRRPGVPLVKFVVRDGAREDNASVAPGTVLRPHTPILPEEIVATRRFEFDRSGGRWTINGEEFDPDRDDARPRLGTAERWIIRNNSGGWAHPIHMHLEAHQIEKIDGRPPPPWDAFNKDTTLLDRNTEASVLMRFRTFPGRYVFHCHNIEHEDMRMMGTFNVIPPEPSAPVPSAATPPPAGQPPATHTGVPKPHLALGKLNVAARVKRPTLGTKGLVVTMGVPKGAKVVRLRLVRRLETPRGSGRFVERVVIAKLDRRISKAGSLTITIPARLVKALPVGQYIIRATPGEHVGRLGATSSRRFLVVR